jgi:hypothetical protein
MIKKHDDSERFRQPTKIKLKDIRKRIDFRIKHGWNQYIYITKSAKMWKILEKLVYKKDNILDLPDYMRLKILPHLRSININTATYIVIVNNIQSISDYEKAYFVSFLIDSKNKQIVKFERGVFESTTHERRTKLII